MGKPCYAKGYWTALDTLRLLATIEEQRARVSVLEEALRELVAEFDQDNERCSEMPGYGDVPDTGGMLLARAALEAGEKEEKDA
jgi:hypothetical protein